MLFHLSYCDELSSLTHFHLCNKNTFFSWQSWLEWLEGLVRFSSPSRRNMSQFSPFTITVRTQEGTDHTVALHEETDAQVKALILASVGLPPTTVPHSFGLWTDGEHPVHVPCRIQDLRRWHDDLHVSAAVLHLRTELGPSHCAIERASLSATRFAPPQSIFRPAPRTRFSAERDFPGTVLASRFELSRALESGSFGTGFVAIDRETTERCFVKIFKLKSQNPEHTIAKEVKVLLHEKWESCIRHPNIAAQTLMFGPVVRPGGLGHVGNMFFIQGEMCDLGEVFHNVCHPTIAPWYVSIANEKVSRRLVKGIVCGLAHLHSHGCYHRDLSLENLVLGNDLRVKLIDFGTCKFAEQCQQLVDAQGATYNFTGTALVGKAGYRAPDMKSGEDYAVYVDGQRVYDAAAQDIWSL